MVRQGDGWKFGYLGFKDLMMAEGRKRKNNKGSIIRLELTIIRELPWHLHLEIYLF